MARYFFHIRDGDALICDEEGQELADLEAVHWEAKQSAREIIAERLRGAHKLGGDLIEVEDENGTIIEIVKFSDLVK
jgi:hypothetical protein